MTKTKNYNLPQWEASDPVRREDFNQVMVNIEAGLDRVQATADAAQDAADTAQSAAETAQAAAEAAATALPYVIGTYVGDLGKTQITLGFKPRLVIISGESNSTDTTQGHLYSGMLTAGQLPLSATLEINGFSVCDIGDYYPHLNESDRLYRYIAFR